MFDLPLLRQLRGRDKLGRGAAVKSRRSEELRARTATADRVVELGLPLLRRRLRAERLRQGRGDRPDRGRPRRPAQPRPALPEGLGDQAAGHRLLARAARPLPPPGRHRLGAPRPGDGDGDDRRPGRPRPARGLGGRGGRRPPAPLHEHRRARRRHPRQRGELPDQEAPHRARDHPDREPGAGLPQLDRGRARHQLRPRRVLDPARGPAELRPDRARGLEHGRGPSGRLPVGGGGEGARRDDRPRRSALQPHQRDGRPLRAAPRGHRHRLPRRHHQPRPHHRIGLPRVRPRLHQRLDDRRRGLRGRGRRGALLRLRRGDDELRPGKLAVRRRLRRRRLRAARPGGQRPAPAGQRPRRARAGAARSSATRPSSTRAASGRS